MSPRFARTHPRAVLLGALLFAAGASGLYALRPWVLPVRIIEGPLVQQVASDGATLIWYTTRPLAASECQVAVTIGRQEHCFAVQTNGRRNRTHIDGLAAGQAYPYRIRVGRRTLAEATLHTNKTAGQSFSFIVFGDSGRGTVEQYQLAGQMLGPAVTPDFVLHTGDLIYDRGQRRYFKDRFFVPYRRLLAQVSFWPCLGNHDVSKPDFGRPYFEVFDLPENGPPGVAPERNYWFDYAAARVAVVDSNADATTLEKHVAPWLRQVLTSTAPAWKFVVFHHPPYTVGAHKPDLTIRRTLVPVCEETGVDIVFSGHDHMYERTYPMRGGERAADGVGVVYVVTGAGGAQLYDVLPPEQRPAYVAALNNQRHSFTCVQLDDDELRVRQIDLEGKVLDVWTTTRTERHLTSRPTTTSTGAGEPVRVAP